LLEGVPWKKTKSKISPAGIAVGVGDPQGKEVSDLLGSELLAAQEDEVWVVEAVVDVAKKGMIVEVKR